MVLIKELTEVSDLQQIPGLEQAIWGNPDPVPTSIMRVMADHGGGIWGAMEDEVWIGFAMAMAARDENGWYLHSHQAGVLAPYRARGVGRALKLAQREWAHRRGYPRIGWTFDPLRASNAHFNLAVLGAQITRYFLDYYGILDSNLNRGLPTDRVFCEWSVDPSALPTALGRDRILEIEIPPDIGTLKETDLGSAAAWQRHVRTQFMDYLAQGWVPRGFERLPSPRYILSRI